MWYENKATILSFKMVYSDCLYNISTLSYTQKHLVIQIDFYSSMDGGQQTAVNGLY